MAWIDVIKRLLPTDTNHADNFNAVTGEIENNLGEIKSLNTALTAIVATKANKAQEDWISATLQNGWVPAPTVQYFKDNFNIVHVKGRITGGLKTSATIVFQLPIGYFPTATQYFCNISYALGTDAVPCIIVIDNTGKVTIGFESKTTIVLELNFKI